MTHSAAYFLFHNFYSLLGTSLFWDTVRDYNFTRSLLKKHGKAYLL